MNWQEALEHIESAELDAELNFASGTTAFFQRVGKEPVIQEALRLVSDSGDALEEVVDRIYCLAMAETDPDYANPNDTPLAVLLWLAYFTAPHCANVGAHYIVRAPGCLYADKLAHHIMTPEPNMTADSWGQTDSEKQVSYTSSSKAESLNLISRTDNFRVAGIPPIGVASSMALETEQLLAQWSGQSGLHHADVATAQSGSTTTSGGPRSNMDRWYVAYNKALPEE